jgi:hypothetical protein
MKSERVIEVRDRLLQVTHLSQLLEALEKSDRQVAQQISALDVPQKTLLGVVSMLRNCAVQSFPAEWGLLNTPTTELASNVQHHFL